jgi:S-DNA-T family DNA segregation ATPase FtsK/SpoIIIE
MESGRPSGHEPGTPAPPMPSGEIVLQSPPEVPEQAADGFAQVLMYLPMGAMAIGMVAVMAGGHASAVMYVGSGAMAVGMVGMMFGQVARGKGDRKVKLNGLRRDYLRYLSQVRAKVRQAAAQQRAAMERGGPDPGALSALVLAGEVWDRAPGVPGFLNARVATGTQVLAVRLVPPETKPAEDLDPLCAGALRRFVRTHSSVPALPVSVSLGSVTRVCLTGDEAARDGLVRALIAQLAVSHSPRDVSVVVCASPDRIAAWEWIKWLPHNRHPDEVDAAGPARLMVPGMDWLPGILGKEVRERPRFTPGPGTPGTRSRPCYVVIADGVAAEGEIAGLDGVVILDLSPSGADSRDPCVLRLRVTPDRLYRLSGREEIAVGVPDALSVPEAEALARMLCPLRPRAAAEQREDALAADVSLAALLGVGDPGALDAESMWRRRAPRDLLRVPIGTDADGNPVELDIKESAQGGMGPHGLVVGATGSGKSELLRTLVLGLAMTHDPSELNFVLVDFKGGATFLGLDTLPHVSAVITNLADELPLVDRMRDALHGEIVRRQEVFRAAGNYASLRDYSRSRAEGAALEPMPALFVVLDEFSELLAAKPEFIDLFVMIGRVGRSLGVHLLLASQRLEEGRLRGLETQLSYRIGLRTFSAMESRTVLGVPDAYELPSRPGNGYLKVDTTGMTRFKAAYVSGPAAAKSHHRERSRPARSRPVIAPFGPAFIPPAFAETAVPEPPAETPAASADSLLDVVVRQIAGHGRPAHQIWLPPLDEPPPLDALLPPLRVTARGLTAAGDQGSAGDQGAGAPHAVLGLVDKPFEQRRDPLWADLSGGAGHVAVVGAPRSGKSTALRTLISSLALLHTPAEVQFYILDFGGGTLAAAEGLPHVGGAATRLAADRVRRTVAEVRALLERREASFADRNIESIAAYRRMVAAGDIEGDGFGDVFLVVDGWLTLRQDFEELEPVITSLAARGLGYGIHLAAAANKWSQFRPAIRDLFGTRLELRLGDPYESEAGRAAAANVPEGAPGRGLTRDGLHFLAAVPRIDGQHTASGLAAAAQALVTAVRDAWPGAAAPPVRMLPAVLPAAELPAPDRHRCPFGIDENALATVSADFGADPHFLIVGDTECGKSNLLRVLCAGIARARPPEEAKMIFIDYRRSLLDAAGVPHQIGYATSSAAAGPLLADVREALLNRLPPPDLTAEQLRARSWWSGSELYLVVDDYDLVAGSSGSPLQVLAELLPQARDIGLHLLLARSAGGAGRAMFEPVIQRLREMGTPGVIMSGSRDEGQLFGGVRPVPQPAGRGFFVERRSGSRLVQTALMS